MLSRSGCFRATESGRTYRMVIQLIGRWRGDRRQPTGGKCIPDDWWPLPMFSGVIIPTNSALRGPNSSCVGTTLVRRRSRLNHIRTNSFETRLSKISFESLQSDGCAILLRKAFWQSSIWNLGVRHSLTKKSSRSACRFADLRSSLTCGHEPIVRDHVSHEVV